MHTFTLTQYNSIGEKPSVILVDHPYSGGEKFSDIESLKEAVGNKRIYFVALSDNTRIEGLENWNKKHFDWVKFETVFNKKGEL